MELTNIYTSQVNGVNTDFRAEVIAAELIENGTPPDNILIVPLGAMDRPQRKDIDSVEQEISDYDNREFILIKTHKEGLYDKLPEGLFHSPIAHVSNKGEKGVIDAIRLHRKEEKEARRFFLPLDAAINSVRVQIALYENQLDKKFHYNELVNIFSGHWEIFKYLTIRQANIFLQVLPILHQVRDQWPEIAGILEQMFEAPVTIQARTFKPGSKSASANAQTIQSALGTSVLGVDMITGSITNEPGSIEIVIKFGPVTAVQLQQFTTGKQQKTIGMLCDYFFPADVDVAIDYELEPGERGFRLGTQGDDCNCSMGVSTFL